MAKRQFKFTQLTALSLSKTRDVLPALGRLSANPTALARVQTLTKEISKRIDASKPASPAIDGKKTNPFVLAAHSRNASLQSPIDLDAGLSAAKEFSSLETSLGKVVEDIVPAIYGWKQVPSQSHTLLSEIDSAKVVGTVVHLAALKSGPACMNDSMVNRIGSAVADNCIQWAKHWNVTSLEYTVGMNYSTFKSSNKKDWYAVHLAEESLKSKGAIIVTSCVNPPDQARAGFEAQIQGITIKMNVKQGKTFWDYIAIPEPDAYLELCCALTLVAAQNAAPKTTPATHTIGLKEVSSVPAVYPLPANTPITQNQLPWLFLFIRHFVDQLTD
jgi:hypothetical protein